MQHQSHRLLKMSFATLLTVAVLASGFAPLCLCRYTPDWASLDSRPLPDWYDQSKVGIFIHWGVFSVPSYRSEWFWWDWQGSSPQPDVVNFMKRNYPPGFTYADFAPKFRATFFNPDQWAELFDSSGAKYIVFTSKHHEGFCNWDTSYSFNWNSRQVGPNRDLVADLAAAIRKRPSLRFGLYHSLYEWFNPLYQNDQRAQFKTRDFVQSKTMPELYELVQRFRPDVVWSDGDWDAPAEYWNSTGFLAWLYNDSPVKDTVVTNDRWGQGVMCKHGGYYTCQDRYNPGILQPHKWENCMTLDKQSWGYRRNARLADYLTPEELLGTLATTISCGGNLLVNIGPTADGTIDPVMEERLRQLGSWLGVNGEAVYNSTPWSRQNDTATSGVWYTQRAGFVYAFLLNWPAGNRLLLGSVAMATNVSLLGHPTAPAFSATPQGLSVVLPGLDGTGLRWAWVLRLAGVKAAASPTHSSSSSGSNGVEFNRQILVENQAANPDVL